MVREAMRADPHHGLLKSFLGCALVWLGVGGKDSLLGTWAPCTVS